MVRLGQSKHAFCCVREGSRKASLAQLETMVFKSSLDLCIFPIETCNIFLNYYNYHCVCVCARTSDLWGQEVDSYCSSSYLLRYDYSLKLKLAICPGCLPEGNAGNV